ncbi:hypothetical protein BG74_05370 [Sodalis-like endosymbiont of Proechinophthirus fluctus]|uniref:protein YgfX n=1 Tax=Sodalis-like endosymbiont of Proechinophthirus fluctus TaxID=1462730 RepID=UPI0007A908F8|nr:protein YgfX [Sodalis-like endosymbiont of Proechinophthirus fluctus]KYP97134.1 hypothetical protein BG74_05370 [Sodalis-like endosymbiont of Proechinophthirus fluctus]
MLILLSPWPENYRLVWLTLVLMSDSSIQWHREEWTFTRKAWMLKASSVADGGQHGPPGDSPPPTPAAGATKRILAQEASSLLMQDYGAAAISIRICSHYC